MMNNDKGRGGTGPRKEGVNVPRYCISPQLAPPVLSPAAKKMFARSEDYHSLGVGKDSRRK
jgi:hypothetical protein